MASGINIDLNIGAAFGAIRGWLDDRKFSDQERAEVELQLGQAELEAQRSAMDMAARIAAAESAVVVAEAQGGSWLQRNWRPMLMVLFALLVLLMWCGVSSDQLTEELKLELMSLIKLGMGGYIAGRSIEKATQNIATAVAHKPKRTL